MVKGMKEVLKRLGKENVDDIADEMKEADAKDDDDVREKREL